MFPHINQTRFGKALPVQVSHRFSVDSAVFDDDNLVSCAGLVPVMALAERTGMSDLLAQMVHIAVPRIKSGSANPAPKLATLIAGMCAGADCIDDVDVVRSGGRRWGGGLGGGCVGEPICCPALACALSSTSTHCCARSTGTPNRARA